MSQKLYILFSSWKHELPSRHTLLPLVSEYDLSRRVEKHLRLNEYNRTPLCEQQEKLELVLKDIEKPTTVWVRSTWSNEKPIPRVIRRVEAPNNAWLNMGDDALQALAIESGVSIEDGFRVEVIGKMDQVSKCRRHAAFGLFKE